MLTGATILGCSAYFIFNALHFFLPGANHLGKYLDVKWILRLHILGGAIALLLGPFQLRESFRNKRMVLHRWLGRVYVLAICISAPCAVYLSCTTAYEVSGSYAFSLQVWVCIWLVSTLTAYFVVRLRKIRLHQEWMVRSYLLTLAFVVSALLLKIPFIAGLGSFAEVSPGLFWVSWAVPLFIYDLYLSYQRKQ